MKKCKICNTKTTNGFNINFELVPICENCSSAIFIQQAMWYHRSVPLAYCECDLGHALDLKSCGICGKPYKDE